ncbi:sodium/potassium-transporting ATPase subunit beta [Sarotherodon galilaeus]
MPRKQKKSQAAKQRWKKFHEFHSVPTCEQAECDFPQSSAEDSVSPKTNAECVKQAGQHVPAHIQQVSYADAVKSGLQHEFNEQHVSSAPQVGCADIVKRGRHSDVVGRSHAERVNLENQPSVTHVCASHSQSHPKYGDSRNKQCTCNSLTFLAFLHENENMATADLNLVLDKGDVMYKEAKKRFPKNIHLATDELPDKVDARRSMYHVDMTQPSRYGTFEEPPEEAVDTFLSLEAGLSCLLSDVQYALLIMSGLCIAVFRSTSGKYGFFDPHSRTPSGLPLPLQSRNRGTAVMLKFTLLSDMIKRIQDSYEMMEISPSCNYELKPVQFYSVRTVNLSDTITDTVCRPTAATAVAPTHSDTTVDEANSSTSRRNTTTDLTEISQMSVCTPLEKQQEVCMTQFTSHEAPQNEITNIPTEEPPSEFNFLSSNDAFCCQSNAALKNISSCDLSNEVFQKILKLKKVNKQQRRKMKRRLMASEKPRNQRKENQKKKERQKYASNKEYKEKKKSCTSKAYKNNPEVRRKQQQYMKRRYCENDEFRQKKEDYIKRYFSENATVRQKQRQYIKRRYCENDEFRKKQQLYIKRRYCDNAEFRQKQKNYITKRYQECPEFRERQRSRVTQRYAHDNTFRLRHRQLMKQLMRDRYQSNLAFRIMHNMRCAMKIKRKYRWVNRQTQESDNSVITEAISVFKSQIKAGPSYPCTVCFKASFPNQVRPCTRSNYVKNPHVGATCLTGRFVHVCDENCRNEQCNVPDERKREWICHTCHNHLKNGSMPALAVSNKLDLADIPPELSDLNILERHLIAKCIPFAKIIPLPKGRQRAIRGNVVCVPSEVQETVEALPRLRINSQVMRVKLKRRLSYKGHQLFQTVSWSKLVQALHKLKQIHPQYKDVSIRDDAELCDPTLPDEDDDDDDDENMNEDDYDEADLMEIDSFLDNTTPESSNVWMTSLNDKYKARPETPEYEEMCMADFAATCRIVYGQQTKDHELKTPSLPTYQAFYGAGCVQLPGTDRLEYVQHIVKRNREKYEKNSEEIESAVEEYEQNRDARLKQIKGTRRPFGGMSVIAVGDFYQLPPVRQSKPLCVHDPSEIDLWREHFQMITLTEIMLQKDDVVFAEMLNRIRVKGKLDELCEADRDLLSQAITEPALCPTDALHIFATNKEVDAHNSSTLALLHTHIIDIHADDYRKDPRTGRMALQDRPLKGGKNELPDTLKVAEGARVMLTRNIDIQNGLVNGAFGKLLRVVYSENDQHIIKLGLKMDIETSGKNNRTPADNMVYIERAEENLKQKGVSIFEPGMAYVAVSRVTSLSGLYLLDMEEKKIFTNPEITAALENMRQANLDDMMPLLHIFEYSK